MSANSSLIQNRVASLKSLADLASGSHSNNWRCIFGTDINDYIKVKKESNAYDQNIIDHNVLCIGKSKQQ